jgi:integrase
VIRKRRDGLQVQVYAGRDPLTGRKRWVSRQVPGQTKQSYRQAKKVEAELLEQVDRGQHRGSPSRTVAELIERWFSWRQQVRPISPVTLANYRGAIDRYILPNLGRAKVQQVDASTIDALYEHVRAHGGKCRHCWRRVRRGVPPLRVGERYRPLPGADEAVHTLDFSTGWPLSASAVREVHTVLSGAFKQALVWGWIVHNPSSRPRRQPAPRPGCHRPTRTGSPGSSRWRWKRIRSLACSCAWPWCSALAAESSAGSSGVTSTWTPARSSSRAASSASPGGH